MTIFECCAAWASIVGLVVTVWTCWKVKAVKDAIDLHKRERAFRLRLPELLAELEKHVLVISSAANSRKKFDEGVVVSVLAICSNIRNLDTKKNISIIKLQRLEELSKRDAVKKVTVEPYQEYRIAADYDYVCVNGPAIILIVSD